MDDLSDQVSQFSFTFSLPGRDTSPVPLASSTSPFDKLPLELTSWIIFWAIIDTFGSPQHSSVSLQQHRNFSSVCRTWRGAVLGAPYLWTCINATNMLERRLYLSKAAPLNINLLVNGSHQEIRSIQTLLGHRHRWKRLALVGPLAGLHSVLLHLREDTPALECLSLKCLSYRATIDLSRISTPRLVDLRVSQVGALIVGTGVLRRIQCLRIASSSYLTSGLHQILSYCQCLTILELERIEIRPELAADEHLILAPIKLPKLAHLRISEAYPSAFLPLLRLVDAPVLQSFVFSRRRSEETRSRPEVIFNKGGFPSLIATVLNKNMSSRRMVAASVGHLKVTLPDVLTFELGYLLKTTVTTLQKAIPVFRLDHGDVVLEISLNEGDPEDWKMVFEAIRLVSLQVSVNQIGDLQWLCDYLGQSFTACSHLTHLRILPQENVLDRNFTDRDVEAVAQKLLRSRRRLVVKLGAHKVFNLTTGKFQRRMKEGSYGEEGPGKGSWKFAF